MSSAAQLDYAVQPPRHVCYERFLAHRVMVCHGCNAKDACCIERPQRIDAR